MPGSRHNREVSARPAGRIQERGRRWAPCQQSGYPFLLYLRGIAVLVVACCLLVIACENRRAALIKPGLPVHGASSGTRSRNCQVSWSESATTGMSKLYYRDE